MMKMEQESCWAKLLFLIVLFGISCPWVEAQEGQSGTYVGSENCLLCHEAEYENFSQYARKSHSFQSVLKMQKGLTPQEVKGCYACHTTGYGQPGGFVSVEETPELKNAGCEVCHGPGGRHASTENPEHIIGEVTIDICNHCHTEERVNAFRYRPLIHGGGH
jgi:hypothetical protein